MKRTIDLKNDLEEIPKLKEAMNAFGKEASLPDPVIQDACFALEEIVSNIINHGFESELESRIRVEIHRQGGSLFLETRDEGKPFDPLEAPDPDVEKPFEEREAGGLGIFLVKNMLSDEQEYRMEGGINILRVRIDLNRESP